MKKKLYISIIFTLLFLFNSKSAFATLNTDFIAKVEKNLFICSYKNENMPKRLDRIELNVYGQKKSLLNEIQRINEIKKVFPLLIVSNQKKIIPAINKTSLIKPKTLTALQKISTLKNPENYPILNEMEKKVFNNTYESDNIYVRLDRIEMKVFKDKSNGNLIDRVEHLKAALMPQDLIAENQMGNDKAQEVQKLLNSLETMEFGLNYPQDSIENRIARLETKIFNNVSSNDPTIERLERLVAVQEAQPSSQEINQQAGTLPKKVFTSRVTQIGTIIFILLSLIL